MADEPTPQPPAQPAFNEDALASRLTDGVRQVLNEVTSTAQQQVQRQQAFAASRQDPIQTQVIEPYVAPQIRALGIMNAAATDAATFYHLNPDAAPYAQEIERRFNTQMQTAMAQGGTPYDRKSVWEHYRGQNFDEFATRRQQQLQQAAQQGAVVGAPGVGRPNAQPFDKDSFRRLSLEDMEKAMGDRTF